MPAVIQVSNLSKIYRLGEIGTGTISRDLERWYKMRIRGQEDPFLKIGETNVRSKKGVSDIVYALRDINFEVQQGEALGIIGKNGAGKSTLLKIISRVTSPTTGKIKIKGRVASLLEVGTGFHPELTGRENIYLNGAILGMRKNETTRKLDEIIDFSGVERYIDTPVKRYSSGMYLRLAFAVAAHLESEILIIDEVLAVGDAEFQKKCLGKMGEVSKDEGRTVLFVSHNMGAISQLCGNCMWIDKGMLKEYGKTIDIVNAYVRSGTQDSDSAEKHFEIDDNKLGQLERVRLLNENHKVTQNFSCDEQIVVELTFRVNQTIPGLYCWLDLSKTDGTLVLMSDSFDTPPNPLDNLIKGLYLIKITIPPRTLASGDYNINLVFTGFLGGAMPVDDPGIVGHIRLDDFISTRGNRRPGFFSTLLPWEIRELM